MTTITNFLQANFVEQEGLQEKQTPIWVLLSKKYSISFKTLPLLQKYMIQQSVHNSRPLLHVDLGLSSLHQIKQSENIPQVNASFYKINNAKSQYLLRWSAQQRRKPNSLKQLIKTINQLPLSQYIRGEVAKNNLPEKMRHSMGLLITGIQIAMTLPKFAGQLEQFIGSLANIHKNYKQIALIVHQTDLLTKQIQFALERISTCLTEIEEANEEKQWICSSTVRRYTGFSNEEKYFIRPSKVQDRIRVKVEKFQKKKEESETNAQKQMISSLGFGIKKQGKEKKDEKEEIKKMIYPHLRVREDYQSGKSQAKCCNCDVSHCPGCEGDEDLIILDDEQEQEDDIDV